jgi:hypothetical protein
LNCQIDYENTDVKWNLDNINTKLSKLQSGAAAYQNALQLHESNNGTEGAGSDTDHNNARAHLLYDMGVNHYYQYRTNPDSAAKAKLLQQASTL